MKTLREWIPDDDIVSDFVGMVFVLTLFASALALGFIGVIALLNAPGATMPLPGQAPEARAEAKEAPMPATEDDLLFNRKATTLRIVDGDTFDARVSLGFGLSVEPVGKFELGRFRMYGINTPETHKRMPGLTDAQWVAEKAAGEKSKARLAVLMPVGQAIYIRSMKPDKYGRWLCVAWTSFADFGVVEKSVNAQMLGEGFAKANSYGDEPLLKAK